MAEALKPNGHGKNGPPELTEDEFLALYQEREEAKSAHAAALEACKAPKKRLTDVNNRIAERMSLDVFERTMEDILKPSFQREQEAAEYHRTMAWLGKPVPIGGQAAFDFEAREPGSVELLRIEKEGFASGRAGNAAETNTYTPGTARFEAFESNWKRGHDEWYAEQQDRAAKLGPGSGEAPKRRGRPAGSKNKPKGSGATT